MFFAIVAMPDWAMGGLLGQLSTERDTALDYIICARLYTIHAKNRNESILITRKKRRANVACEGQQKHLILRTILNHR